jgi:hypothetical protein
LLLALAKFEGDIGPHGQLLSEATDPGANPTEYDNPLRFESRGPFTDWAEKSRLDAIDAYKAKFPKDTPPNMNGMYWVVDKAT